MEDTIINLISNVGFPIVVSIALFYQMNKTDDMYISVLRDFKQVIDNNTRTLQELNRSIRQADLGVKDDV